MKEGRTLRAEELSGDVQGLAADDNNLLAVEELLGDDACETTQKVPLAVNDDLKSPISLASFFAFLIFSLPCS